MNDHVRGLLVTTLGVLFVVSDSLFIRLIDAGAPTITFWRGMVSGTLVLIGVLMLQGVAGFRAVLRTGWPGLLYTLLFAAAAPGFVLAVTLTSVANVVFIIAAMPVFAAIFSRLFPGEPISRRMVLTMAGVFPGMAIIAYGSGETANASWQGDLVALCVAAAFAGAMTTVRKLRATPMIPAVPVAMIGAALVMWPRDGDDRLDLPAHPRAALYQLGRGGAAHPAGIGPGADPGLGRDRRGSGALGARARCARLDSPVRRRIVSN